MAKIENDKYYTPVSLAKECIDKTFKIIGEENISDIIEPSAGNGSFSNQLFFCTAYDIEPESNNIIKQDFLKLDLPYKKGRLIIGNPPYSKGQKSANDNAQNQSYTKLDGRIAKTYAAETEATNKNALYNHTCKSTLCFFFCRF